MHHEKPFVLQKSVDVQCSVYHVILWLTWMVAVASETIAVNDRKSVAKQLQLGSKQQRLKTWMCFSLVFWWRFLQQYTVFGIV